MSKNNNRFKELVNYRLKKAKEKLQSAKNLYENRNYEDSVSRSYYAMLLASRAVLATKGLHSKTHSGTISLFGQHFVKEKLFPEEVSKFFPKGKRIREDADYGDFTIITDEDAKGEIENAGEFVKGAEHLIKKLYKMKEV